MNNLKQNIINKIEKGEVKMRPRIYFVLKTVFLIGIILVMATLILFLTSFIHFSLKMSGACYLPRFGLTGLGVYFKSLPWLLILLSLFLIFILEIIAKRFSFVWKKPILYSLISIILISIIGVFLIDQLSVHQRMLLRTRKDEQFLMAPVYREISNLENIYKGTVEEVLENGFLILSVEDELLTVILNKHNKHTKNIIEKDNIIVFGERRENIIESLGVRKVNEDFDFIRKQQFYRPRQRNKNSF